MTDNGTAPELTMTLPLLVSVPDAFTRRMPSQRQLDLLGNLEPGVPFAELAQTSPFRMIAWRALMRDYPHDDPARLWLHAYDVEVEIQPADPTGTSSTTPSPVSSTIGD